MSQSTKKSSIRTADWPPEHTTAQQNVTQNTQGGAKADALDFFWVAAMIGFHAATTAFFQMLPSHASVTEALLASLHVLLFMIVAFVGEWWMGALLKGSGDDSVRTAAFRKPSRRFLLACATTAALLLSTLGVLLCLVFLAFIVLSWAAYPLAKHFTGGKNVLVATCFTLVACVYPMWACNHWPTKHRALCALTFLTQLFLECWFDTFDHASDTASAVRTVSTRLGQSAARQIATLGAVCTCALSVYACWDNFLVAAWNCVMLLAAMFMTDDAKGAKHLVQQLSSTNGGGAGARGGLRFLVDSVASLANAVRRHCRWACGLVTSKVPHNTARSLLILLPWVYGVSHAMSV